MTERLKLKNTNTFCWVELACGNLKTSKDFYGNLLGWSFNDNKEGGGIYTHIQTTAKKLVGGMYQFTLPKAMKSKQDKIDAFWTAYFSTEDIIATVKKAESLGGKALTEITDIDGGRMCAIQDPTGASFNLWEAKEHHGFEAAPETTGSAGWVELHTDHEDVAVQFYSQLFGWGIEKHNFQHMTYIMFTKNDKPVCGMMRRNEELSAHPHWLIYFNVEDCDESTELAKKQKAKVLYEPTTFKHAGRMSVLKDKQGAVFAIIKYQPNS